MPNVPKSYIYKKKIPPCKDCLDREIGCHAWCEKYREWSKNERIKHDEAINKQATERMVADYEVKEFMKRKRRYGR